MPNIDRPGKDDGIPVTARPFETPPILVFDSGVGGLTVAAEIAAILPSAPLLYVCDNDWFPYGVKPEAALVDRVASVIESAVARFAPLLAVIACNTASTVALPRLRAAVAPPIVGVVPAIKPAAAASRNRVIGLLGTPGTVRRRYTQELIDRFAGDCTVIRIGSAELVEMAEAKLRGEAIDLTALAAILAGFFAPASGEKADTVVLACTHFPLLGDELAQVAPAGTVFVDSGAAVAQRVLTLLAASDPVAEKAAPGGRVLFTAPELAGAARIAAFEGRGFRLLR
jgi:glutamate racemase